MIGTISIEDVVKGVVVNGENVVDYDGIAKIVIPDPPEVPVKDVKVDGESVVDPQGDANIVIPVKDVKVDGESVIDSEGVANITIPDPPEVPVKDVKVDGESVVNAQGVANVVVPVISNLRIVKQLPGVPAAVATVSDAEAFTMPSLKVAVEAWQEGSGNPSPSNVRPIHGWDEVNVTVTDDVVNPTVENVYTIDLDGTRYGGRLEIVNGVARFVATHGYADLGTLSWAKQDHPTLGTYFYGNATSLGIKATGNYSLIVADAICSHYTATRRYATVFTNGTFCYDGSTTSVTQIQIKDDNYSDAETFATAMNGVQLVYELAEPVIITLGNYPISSLVGVNNIYADSGKVLQGEYASNIKVVDIG